MTIDTSFMKKKILKKEVLYVLYCPYTHMPYVECNEDTAEDEVFVFTTEEMTQAFAKGYIARKIPLQALRIPRQAFPEMLKNLHQMGVASLQFQEEGAPIRVALSDLADPPTFDEEAEKKVPVSNPELQLTGIYFMQLLRRPGEREPEERKQLRDLEEELAHHLFRSKVIVAFDVTDVKKNEKPTEKKLLARQPMLKLKDGRAFLPVFSELGEFHRFASQNTRPQTKMRLVAIEAKDLLHAIPKPAFGCCLNPAGFNLLLPREQLERLWQSYGPREKNNETTERETTEQ